MIEARILHVDGYAARMITGIDHVVIGSLELDPAVRELERCGFAVHAGGEHPALGTHNGLVRFADNYIEVLALLHPSGGAGLADVLADRRGFVAYALRSDDIEADAVRLGTAGLHVLGPMEMQRERPDGVVIRWKGVLPGESMEDLWQSPMPFIIEWADARTTGFGPDPMPQHDNGAAGLARVWVAARDVAAAADLYVSAYGLRRIADDALACGGAEIRIVGADGGREGICRVDLAARDERRLTPLGADLRLTRA